MEINKELVYVVYVCSICAITIMTCTGIVCRCLIERQKKTFQENEKLIKFLDN